MTDKQERSIKQRIGRAIAKFRRDHNQDAAYGSFISGNTVHVETSVAGGDNVSWARVPMAYIWQALNPICKQDGQSSHCCGDVGSKFILR